MDRYRASLWCYVGLPLTAIFFCWNRDGVVRHQARIAVRLGCTFIVALSLLGLTEVVVGMIAPPLGRWLGRLTPLCGLLFGTLWALRLWQIYRTEIRALTR